MGSISGRAIGQQGRWGNRRGLSCLQLVDVPLLPELVRGALAWGALAFGVTGCGGEIAEGEMPLTGGGGQSSTLVPSGGGSPATTTTAPVYGGATSTAAAVCFGRNDIAVKPGCVTYDVGPFKATDACIFQVAILPNYKLNPAYLTIYFTAADGTKYVIPYIGGLADCAAQTSYGGWYATNTSGGSSEIGFCPCTCNAARKHAATALIDCAGIPGS